MSSGHGAPKARWWVLPLVLVGFPVLAFVGYAIVWPRIVFHRVDAYVARHPVGSSIDEAVRDTFVRVAFHPFLTDAEGIVHDDRALPERVAAHPDGSVHLMWIYMAPFGRVGVTFDYDHGVIRSARRTALD